VSVVELAPSGRRVEVSGGTTLFEAVRLAGMPLGSSCGGEGACGWCRVTVMEGRAALSRPDSREVELLARIEAGPDERVACLAAVQGDLVCVTTSYW
jgi:ferredoxin